MPEKEFASLKERLLRGGVAPRQVERLLLELKTHAAALLDEEIARGQPLEAARALARSRLGSDDEILAKALEQRALMSWGTRWPVIVCALLPPVALLALSVGTISALVAIAALGQHWNRDPASWGLGVWSWAHQGTLFIAWLALYGFPVLCTLLLVRYTVTRRLGLVWPLVGVFLTAALGAWTTFTVAWPQTGAQGRLSAGVGLSTDWDNLMRFGARWATTVILALGLYLYMRRREHEVWNALGKHRT
jgi:hypothetical protein